MPTKAKMGRLEVLKDCTNGIHGEWTYCLCILTAEEQKKSRKLLLFPSKSEFARSRRPLLEYKIEQIMDATESTIPLSFKITLSHDYEGPTPAFKATSLEERDSWLRELKLAITLFKAMKNLERDKTTKILYADTFSVPGTYVVAVVVLDSPRARELGIVGCGADLLINPVGYIGLRLEGLYVNQWFLRQIRRYKANREHNVFKFESGRKAPLGEGWWIFESVSAETIYTKMKESENNLVDEISAKCQAEASRSKEATVREGAKVQQMSGIPTKNSNC